MSFTDEIAEYIVEKELDLNHLTIVLPSERAKKYIAASLFKKMGKPILAPKMITIDRWVKGLSTKSIIDNTRALIRLFNIQLQNPENEKDKSFDEFLLWGPILLSDYDEIDRYLLDSKNVFKNLADIKEIEAWSFNEKELTPNQIRFMKFWDRLPGYYHELNVQLDNENMAYKGSAYKALSTEINKVFTEDKERHFLFAGFNAMSPAEMNIIKQLVVMGRGHVLIDADRYYLDKNIHEAGSFMNSFKKYIGVRDLPFVKDQLSTKKLNIEVVECAQTTGQVKVASTKLMELTPAEMNDTLLLLADETLISPLLNNIPKNVQKANITLGLPLKSTALRTWVELVFDIQENKTRFNTEAIYFQDLQKFLNHPFVLCITNEKDAEQIAKIEKSILDFNRIFLNVDSLDLNETLSELIKSITNKWSSNWNGAIEIIRKMNRLLYANFHNEGNFEKASIQGFDEAILDFENIVKEGIPEMSLKSFKSLFNQHWSRKSIAYHGNPMDGLQIMGLLETRLLDFKRVICLGLNEGVMPPSNPIQTMIPMDLRRYLGLPTPREKQGLFAHHFYRLFHVAEEVLITYTGAKEAVGSNEQSRYLLQLDLELSRENPNCNFTRSYYNVPMKEEQNIEQLEVMKTPEILNRLDAMFAKSTSASALKKYVSCPLDFYYRYVLEFGEEDNVEEEVETSTLGTFVHNVLEQLFKPHAHFDTEKKIWLSKDRKVDGGDIEKMLSSYERLLGKEFLDHFGGDKRSFETGKNLLSFKMANELTRLFLEEQKRLVAKSQSLEIISVEELLEYELELEIGNKKRIIHLKGFVDRIDRVNGKVRIIDYKTGKTKDEDVDLKSAKSVDEKLQKLVKPKHTLQLVMYAYLYYMNYGELPDEVGIYSLTNSNKGLIVLNAELKEWVESFPTVLKVLLEEVYNEDIPFLHVENDIYSFCKYCK